MKYLKRWFVVMAVGGTLLVGLTNCVVTPIAPVPSGYVASPPVVVIRPHRPYRRYRHHRHYHSYHPYYGGYPHAYR
jgi:hypothetical protein